MKKISHCLSMIAAALGAPAAYALGLGELHSYSAPGSLLQATVDVYASPADAVRDWQVNLLPDGFAGPDTAPAAVLAGLRARFVRSAQGRSYIQIDSLAPVDYSALAFRLRVSDGAEAMTGRYVVTLAQPTPQPRQKPRRVRTKAALPPPDVGVSSSLDAYGPVRPGESLWTIARKLGGKRDIQSLMQTLFDANPAAFVGGDMNRLRVGATLALPSGSRRATPTLAAPAVQAAPAPQPSAVAGVELVAAPPPAPVAPAPLAGTSPTTTRALAETDPELAARLAALDRKFAEIRAQYGGAGQAEGAPTVTTAVAPEAIPAPVASPVASSSAAPSTPVVAATSTPKPAAKAKPAAALPQPVAVPPAANGAAQLVKPLLDVAERFESFGISPIALFGALAAAGVGVFATRRYLGSRRGPVDARHDPARDATLKAEVARKSENRVRLENELKGLVTPRAGQDYRPDSTIQLSAPPPLPRGSSVNDNSEIDSSIANGFYTEAEQMLRKFIEKDAGNAPAKLRLAEVLYITEQSEAYAALAQDMMARHRKEIADDDWQRVIRMGKMIAPDYPLFSGPRQVGLRA